MAIKSGSFAEACYDQNSVAELEAALRGDADPADCRVWGITPAEWRAQIELALAEKRADAGEAGYR